MSKIQLVRYHQCCILIGWASSWLQVINFCISRGEFGNAMQPYLETDTTDDNKSDWWLSMPNGVSSCKVILNKLFAMVRRFEQEYSEQFSYFSCTFIDYNIYVR